MPSLGLCSYGQGGGKRKEKNEKGRTNLNNEKCPVMKRREEGKKERKKRKDEKKRKISGL